jgi:hypothetical protein
MRCSVISLQPIRCINCTYWILSECIASMNAAWACCAAFGSIVYSLLRCVYYSTVGCCCQAAIKTFSSCSKKKVMLSSPLLYPQRKRTPPSLVSSTESMMTFCRGLRCASIMPALSAVALMRRVCILLLVAANHTCCIIPIQHCTDCHYINCHCYCCHLLLLVTMCLL